MRIVAGRFKGRRLRAPSGTTVRPTSDRVREALFSIIGDRVVDTDVLDLFAGSGALGIEALSRGAASATFVDSSAKALTVVKSNLEALGVDAQLRRMRAQTFLSAAAKAGQHYDLIFLDPPYKQSEQIARELSNDLVAVLAPGAIVVTESDRRQPLELELSLIQERRYGDTTIRIYKPHDPE